MYYSIEKDITAPLDRYLRGEIKEKELDWNHIHWAAKQLRRNYSIQVRDALTPYYERLIYADDGFFFNGNTDTKSRINLLQLMEGEYKGYCRRFNDIDIVAIAERWGEKLSIDDHRVATFMYILNALVRTGYSPDWDKIYAETKARIANARNYGNYKSLEVLCALMADIMISRSDAEYDKKNIYYTKLSDHWGFFAYMYSVMIRRIVGFKVSNFAALASNMIRRTSDYPSMHIFYRAFKDSVDVLCPRGKRDIMGNDLRELAEKQILKMEEIIQNTPPSDDLTPICEILFPKRMSEVLEQQRPKTYKELEADIADLQSRYDKMVEKLAENLQKAVSVDELREAFNNFRPDMAMHMFGSVATLLAQNETWQKYAPLIHKEILQRYGANEVNIMNMYGPVNGNIQSQQVQIPPTQQQPNKQIEQK